VPCITFTSSVGASTLSNCTLQYCGNLNATAWSRALNSTQYFDTSPFSIKPYLNFYSAQSFCKNLWNGGHLASFDRDEMRLKIPNPAKTGYFWIGLRMFFELTQTTYEWIDGLPFNKSVYSYTYKPFSSQIRCGIMAVDQTVVPAYCAMSEHYPFICQIDASHCSPVQRCGIGKFFNASSLACQLCPVGKFQSLSATVTCNLAPIGYFVNEPQSASAKPCLPGKYAPVSGLSSCHSCPEGKFANSRNSSSCLNCMVGQFSNQSASACSTCPKGKYSTKLGSTSCISCVLSTTSSSGSVSEFDCSICDRGSFGHPLIGVACKPCPEVEGIVCDRQNLSSPLVLDGFFVRNCDEVSSPKICEPVEACLSHSSGGSSCPTICAEGYEDSACGKCSFGFYRSDGRCKKCPGAIVKVFTFIGVALVIGYVLYRFIKSSASIPPDVRLAIKCIQTIALFPNITTKWPNAVLSLLQIYSFAVSLYLLLLQLIFT
jgi:hypothetical protein